MKTLLLATALAVGFAMAARAGSVTIDGLTITQIAPENPGAFDDIPIFTTNFVTTVCDSAHCGQIVVTGGLVANQMNPLDSTPPLGDLSHYVYGENGNPATVTFQNPTPSFNFYWGPIHATSSGSVDDVLIVNGRQSVTGTELVAAGSALSPQVTGSPPGTPGVPGDNQWFNISDNEGPIFSFTATSSFDPAFSFDMATVPEPSTWATMLIGFVGLGFAGCRASRSRAEGVRTLSLLTRWVSVADQSRRRRNQAAGWCPQLDIKRLGKEMVRPRGLEPPLPLKN
jgi:hypothetical protein